MGKIIKYVIIAIIVGIGTVAIKKSESDVKMTIQKDSYRTQKINEEAEWVKDNPTRENLVNFSNKYPKHPFAFSARSMIEAIDFKKREDDLWFKIKNMPLESDLVEFIYTFKKSEEIAEAKSILKKLRFSNVSNNLSLSNLKKYLQQYPDKNDRSKLCEKLDSLYWIEAQAENTEYYLARYLFSFSEDCQCKHKKSALSKINEIKSKEFDKRSLINKTYTGVYSENDNSKNLIVQFYELNNKIKASINIGKDRYRNLDVKISNNEFTLIENSPDYQIKHLHGQLYSTNEYNFIESIYYPKDLYWRAKIYVR